MSTKKTESEEPRFRRSSAWLPAFFTIFFTVTGLYVVIFELSPAFQEHRAVRAALQRQIKANQDLSDEIEAKDTKDRSLREDLQATMNELDQRGLLGGQKGPGTSSKGSDRGQSRD